MVSSRVILYVLEEVWKYTNNYYEYYLFKIIGIVIYKN